MATLQTYSQVEDELSQTAGYRSSSDLSLAHRREAALTRKLDFAEQSDENGRMIRFNQQVVESQLNQVQSHIKVVLENSTTNASRIDNPTVLHTDFSGFGGYQ
jgi:hypothetical protein